MIQTIANVEFKKDGCYYQSPPPNSSTNKKHNSKLPPPKKKCFWRFRTPQTNTTPTKTTWSGEFLKKKTFQNPGSWHLIFKVQLLGQIHRVQLLPGALAPRRAGVAAAGAGGGARHDLLLQGREHQIKS